MARSSATADALDALDAPIPRHARPGEPGGVIAIARGGRIVHRRAFGLASLEHGIVNDWKMRFPIGSVTKQFTCAAAVALAAEGRWTLDDPIGSWLPELDGDPAKPTLRQLMGHTGGQRCYLDIAFCDGVGVRPAGAALAIQSRQRACNFAPGTGQRYSNGGYALLSIAIERASGQAFEDVLRTRIFEPLAMGDTVMVRQAGAIRYRQATPYIPASGDAWRRGVDVLDEHLGDGGIVSTASDLLRWAAALRVGNALPGIATLDALARPSKVGSDTSPYGFGLMRETHRGIELVGHGGNVMGANSQLWMAPDHELDVVVLTNTSAVSARALAVDMVEHVLTSALDEPARPPNSADHAHMMGRHYSHDSGRLYTFDDVDGALAFGLQGAAPAPLTSIDAVDDPALPFSSLTATGSMRFRLDDQGLEVVEPGMVDRTTRLDGPASTGLDDGWRFRSDEAAADITVRSVDGRTTIHGHGDYGTNVFSVDAIAPDLMVLRHSLMPWTATARAMRDGSRVAALEVTTARTRKLRFERTA